jgi:hypothetical protein
MTKFVLIPSVARAAPCRNLCILHASMQEDIAYGTPARPFLPSPSLPFSEELTAAFFPKRNLTAHHICVQIPSGNLHEVKICPNPAISIGYHWSQAGLPTLPTTNHSLSSWLNITDEGVAWRSGNITSKFCFGCIIWLRQIVALFEPNVAVTPKLSRLGVKSTQVARLDSTLELSWTKLTQVNEVEGVFFLIASVGHRVMSSSQGSRKIIICPSTH